VSTLVVCLTRGSLGVEPPVVGREAVEGLVTTVGLDDPEDSRVNCILEGLQVARDLEDDVVVAVLAGVAEGVGGERDIARQLDDILAAHDPDSAVVVVDSAENERLVPIVESRLPVDAVDRVVVRQARDIESTYYLLKQLLADEQLRKTVLVPVGLTLIAFPALLAVVESVTVAVGAIAAVFGLLLLYKGLRIDVLLAEFAEEVREALYGGQVSVVTYVVAGGLALVGVSLGVLGASSLEGEGTGELLVAVQFVHESIPWLTGAALVASAGRLLDGFLGEDALGSTYVNLPFVAVAVGLAIRGFTAYFLQISDVSAPLEVPEVAVGSWRMDEFIIAPGTHLAVFILASIVVSLVGVRVASYVSSTEYDGSLDERV